MQLQKSNVHMGHIKTHPQIKDGVPNRAINTPETASIRNKSKSTGIFALQVSKSFIIFWLEYSLVEKDFHSMYKVSDFNPCHCEKIKKEKSITALK